MNSQTEALTVLVIEDNIDNQQLVTWILEDAGYAVDCADTAEIGIEKLYKQTYAIVLMDISLPGIDGKQATILLRKDERFRHLPILALTAHAVLDEREAILASGVDDLLTKPVDEDLLLARIADFTQK